MSEEPGEAGDGEHESSAQERPDHGPLPPSGRVTLDLPLERRALNGRAALPDVLTLTGDGDTVRIAVGADSKLQTFTLRPDGTVEEGGEIELGPGPTDVYGCGAAATDRGHEIALLRRRAGDALEPVIAVHGSGAETARVEASSLPDGWQLLDAGRSSCAAWVGDGGTWRIVMVARTPEVARALVLLEHAPDALDDPESSRVLIGEAEALAQRPSLTVARHDDEILIGATVLDGSGGHQLRVLQLSATGEQMRTRRLGRATKAPAVGAVGWRAGTAGAWLGVGPSTATEAATDDARATLLWAPLEGTFEETERELPLAAWQSPVEWLAGPEARGLFLLRPRVPSRQPERLAAIVEATRPEQVVVWVDAPVLSADAMIWPAHPTAVVLAAVTGMDGTEDTPASASLELRWAALTP